MLPALTPNPPYITIRRLLTSLFVFVLYATIVLLYIHTLRQGFLVAAPIADKLGSSYGNLLRVTSYALLTVPYIVNAIILKSSFVRSLFFTYDRIRLFSWPYYCMNLDILRAARPGPKPGERKPLHRTSFFWAAGVILTPASSALVVLYRDLDNPSKIFNTDVNILQFTIDTFLNGDSFKPIAVLFPGISLLLIIADIVQDYYMWKNSLTEEEAHEVLQNISTTESDR